MRLCVCLRCGASAGSCNSNCNSVRGSGGNLREPAGRDLSEMAAPVPFLVLCVCTLGLIPAEVTSDTLSSLDSSFCHGGLEVIYPELDIDKCLIIPKKHRENVSTVWGAPQVYFSGAKKGNVYVVVMVDPDAPRRTRPTSASWRHWLVVDVQGSSLIRGQVQGTTLTDYHPPTPTPASGFHRYQFVLFKQPPDARVSLAEQEKSSRGKWDLQAFVAKFGLGEPVATLQFLTQNYKD
ncbi:phosphatidylethanolamine-binding protein 4 [Betta splendens]|uniref:Phosphatidylethanolamine-binding protein 4 n=1 Tax=Betta splendens TaxID=158456 RepID=A0A6P7NQQ4_BETSP|nr:phosphatidylethanolamine-binding protein 4 [Betta splendens]